MPTVARLGNHPVCSKPQTSLWYFLMTCCSIIVIATARTGDHFWSLLLAGFLILPSPVSIFLVVHAHWHFTGLAMVYAHHAGKDSLLLPAVSFVAREVVLLAQRGAEEVGRSFLDLSFLRPLAVAVGITSPTATVEGSVPLIIQGAASISAEMAGRAILPLAAIAVGAWALLGVVGYIPSLLNLCTISRPCTCRLPFPTPSTPSVPPVPPATPSPQPVT